MPETAKLYYRMLQLFLFNNINMIYIRPHKTVGEAVERSFTLVAQNNDLILASNNPDHLQEYGMRFGLSKHSSAAKVFSAIGADAWDRYFTWATVRNPYTRIASLYNYFPAITQSELETIGYPLNATSTAQIE